VKDLESLPIGKVRGLVADIVGPTALQGIDDDTAIFEEMVVDSLHLVAIVAALEENFGFTVQPEDLVPDNFRSLRQIAQFVQAKRPAGHG
jgi:acyl carrier protein